MKIILLNGPPRCGKDYAAAALGGVPLKMSRELKDMTHEALGLEGLLHDHFEDQKDERLLYFRGVTPREAYIQMSEGFIKPLYGEDALGVWLAEEIEFLDCHLITISDCGFRPEAEALVRRFGHENVVLVRIHREGHNFKGDSRGYISLADLGVQEWDITNDGGPSFSQQLQELLSVC